MVEEGHPVQIVDIQEHKFKLNEKALRSVLFHPLCKDKKVAVVSIAGAFRKGKSFMLDFFLRYLNSKEKRGWIGKDTEPLTGFHWRGGCDRDTTGILMWSQPFIVYSEDEGADIAVLLMDTQGAFDSKSTVRDCATVFALSLMISSIHIYNLMQNIQEDDLQHLDLFAEYGTLALESSYGTPFQQLTFLVRDWSYPYEAKYGYEGGEMLLKKRFEMAPNQHEELCQVRSRLKDCFKKINCFLMPHPGLKVSTNPDFDGRISDIETEFRKCLLEFVPSLFNSCAIQIKEINGERLTAVELFEYFKAYCAIFEADQLPHPKAMLQATAEANNLVAKATAKQFYIRAMEQHCGGDRPYMHPQHLEACHAEALRQALLKFRNEKKMGGETMSAQYLLDLEKEIEDLHQNYIKYNEGKNIFAFSRTPSTFIGTMIFTYVLSSILDALWLGTFCFLLMFAFYLCFVMLILWLYSKYTGEYKEMGEHIDSFADLIWGFVYQPVYQKFLRTTVQAVVSTAVEDKKTK